MDPTPGQDLRDCFNLDRVAVVLCGGKSQRMGQDKGLMPFGHTSMLQRVVAALASSVAQVAIVGQANQHASRAELFQQSPPATTTGQDARSSVPAGAKRGSATSEHSGANLCIPVQIVDDMVADSGPLEGLRSGLISFSERPPEAIVFVCGCDYPLLTPRLVTWMFESLLADDWAGAAWVDGKYWPLPAVYRMRALPVVEQLLAAEQRSLQALLQSIPVTRFSEAALRAIDPDLLGLRSVDTPEALAQLRHAAKLD